MEIYDGVKFETRFVERRPPDAESAHALLGWCRAFLAHGFATATEASGNLSCRWGGGMIITPTHVSFADLQVEDLVEVVSLEPHPGPVSVRGTREPSSEVRMHAAIYGARPDVQAVFHGHAAAIVAKGEEGAFPCTATELPYGTDALAQAAVALARSEPFFVLRNHGFVATGATMEEAGARSVAAGRALGEA